MAKRRVWLCGAVLGAVIALYLAYPYYTLHRLERALESGNRAALGDLIDWRSLRAGLKEDLNALALRTLAEHVRRDGGGDGVLGAGLAAMLMPMLVQRVVDTFVTPAGIADLMRREGPLATMAQDEVPARAHARDWRFEVHSTYFSSPATFHFEFSNPDDPRPGPAIGVLELQGVRWRLARLILPIEDLAPATLGRPREEPAASLP